MRTLYCDVSVSSFDVSLYVVPLRIRGEQNGTGSLNMCFWMSPCANNKCTMWRDTMQLPHGRNNWNRFVHIYKLFLEVGVNRAGGWKGLVSYGLGADISLPPCQIGCRLVSDTKLTVFAIRGPKSRGYSSWYAALAPRLDVLPTGSYVFCLSQVIRLRMRKSSELSS